MRATAWLRQRVTKLLTAPGEEIGRWARFIRFQIQLWRGCALRLRANNAMAMSAALSFRSIFALVPVLVLAFLLLKSMGIVEHGKDLLGQFLEQSGLTEIAYVENADSTVPPAEMPEADNEITIADKIEDLVDGVEDRLTLGSLGPIGAVLLVWTAITLLTTMERSLNRIFESPRSRSLVKRVMLYWSVLTLVPLALAAAVFLGNKAAAALEPLPAFSWAMGAFSQVALAIIAVLLLAVLYNQMPNTYVKFRLALVGAAVALPLWLLARWGFGLYVDHVGRRSLYGALGLIPLFLVWLNLSWWIFLFGAELAYSAGSVDQLQRADRSRDVLLGPWHLLGACLAVAKCQSLYEQPVSLRKISDSLNLSPQATDELLRRLTEGGVVCQTISEVQPLYVLAKPAEKIRVIDVSRTDDARIPMAHGNIGNAVISETIGHLRRLAERGIEDVSVAEAISEDRQTEGTAQ